MKKSELKSIIRECIEEIELDEKWSRSEEEEFASGDSEVYNHPKHGNIHKMKNGKYLKVPYFGSEEKRSTHPSLISAKRKANEGLRRNRRLLRSKNPDDQAVDRGIKKTLRRNERGQDKYGAVGFANRRLKSMDHQRSIASGNWWKPSSKGK